MQALGPLLPSSSSVTDTGYAWSGVSRSLFFSVFRTPGREIRNQDVFNAARCVNGFSFFASLSRFALTCICHMFRFPRLLIPRTLEHLVSLAELLVRIYLNDPLACRFIRRHYYFLACDALNRSCWRAHVNEEFYLPLSFTDLVGFRARMEYYPRSLFSSRSEFVVYYCYFLRGFMRLLSDRLARASGLMGSVEDDRSRFGTSRGLTFIMAERARFSRIACYSLSNSTYNWAPDVFDGLGAHTSPLWYRREAQELNTSGVCPFSPSLAECRAIGQVLDKICDRFRSSVLSVLVEDLFRSFYGCGSYNFDVDCLGMPFTVGSIVIRSGMLSFSDCPGFVRWLGVRLPIVHVTVSAFRTPYDCVGAVVPMRNFGGRGYTARTEYDVNGVAVPLDVGDVDEYCLHNRDHITYNSSGPYDEVIHLTDVYTGYPILLQAEDIVPPPRL
jgi:hypothetical protein